MTVPAAHRRRLLAGLLPFALAACALIDEPEPGTPGQGLVREGASRLVAAAGVFDTFAEVGEDGATAAAQLGYRHGGRLLGLGPAAGVLANRDGSIATFGGLYADFALGRLMVTPMVGAGAWRRAGGKDLGGTFIVRTEVDIAFVREDGIRVGLRWGHLSNAYVYDDNPGQEDFMFTVAVPF